VAGNNLMGWSEFLAQQVSHPSGLLGKLILPRLWNQRNKTLNDATLAHLAPAPQDRILEIGFGGGYLLERMTRIINEGLVAGVDVSNAMAEVCQKRFKPLIDVNKLELKTASAESLPFPDNHFNKVCSVNSIFYWQNPTMVFSEIRRVLTDEGLLVLCFTCKRSMENKKFAQENQVNLYEIDDAEQMMKTAGFAGVAVHQATDRHREFVILTGNRQ
jgi:SAM-dependent methyltransferase